MISWRGQWSGHFPECTIRGRLLRRPHALASPMHDSSKPRQRKLSSKAVDLKLALPLLHIKKKFLPQQQYRLYPLTREAGNCEHSAHALCTKTESICRRTNAELEARLDKDSNQVYGAWAKLNQSADRQYRESRWALIHGPRFLEKKLIVNTRYLSHVWRYVKRDCRHSSCPLNSMPPASGTFLPSRCQHDIIHFLLLTFCSFLICLNPHSLLDNGSNPLWLI